MSEAYGSGSFPSKTQKPAGKVPANALVTGGEDERFSHVLFETCPAGDPGH
jgi:hypothetical protein